MEYQFLKDSKRLALDSQISHVFAHNINSVSSGKKSEVKRQILHVFDRYGLNKTLFTKLYENKMTFKSEELETLIEDCEKIGNIRLIDLLVMAKTFIHTLKYRILYQKCITK